MKAGHELEPLPLWQTGVALSSAIAIFGTWAWLEKAGVWTHVVTSKSAGFILFAALSVILQASSNFAAAAARRARSFGLHRSFQWAVGLMTMGGAYNAFSFHNALDVCGMLGPDADAFLQVVLFVISIGIAGYEPALYWIDEALRAESDERHKAKIAAEDKRILDEASAREAGLEAARAEGIATGKVAPLRTPAHDASVDPASAVQAAGGVIAIAAALMISHGVAPDAAYALAAPHAAHVDNGRIGAVSGVADTVATALVTHGVPPKTAFRRISEVSAFQGHFTYHRVRVLAAQLRAARRVPDVADDMDADGPDVPLGRIVDAPLRYGDVPLEGAIAHA